MVFKFSLPSALPSEIPPIGAWREHGEAWVDSLSGMKSSEAARSLCTALYGLNRAEVSDAERLQFLEVYRPTMLNLIADLTADYHRDSVALPASTREAANLARRLLVEYAYGYKLMLLDKADGISAGDKRQTPMLLHRAVAALSDTLALSYQTYAPTPAGVWHEIHQIYRYAEHHALDEVAVPAGAIQQSTIGLVYKQALLLALTDPYRLMPGEVDRVLAIVDRFRGGAKVLPYSDGLSGEALFLVQSDGDKPPKPLAKATRSPTVPGDKVLSAAGLVVYLGQHRAQLEAEVSASALHSAHSEVKQIHLLRRLESFWSSPSLRVFNRSASDSGVEICSGIAAVCYFLQQARSQAGAVSRNGATVPESSSADAKRSSAGATPLPPYTHWEISNQSAGGLAVRKTAGADSGISVGEVVAIRYPGQASWGVGAVRWMQKGEQDSLEFGIEMLAPGAVVVSIQPVLATGGKHDAVMLPELPALNKAAALLVPPGFLHERAEFWLTDAGVPESLSARATRLLERTTSFDIFEFIAS
jgi:cyclic-di-GMP-binding protein